LGKDGKGCIFSIVGKNDWEAFKPKTAIHRPLMLQREWGISKWECFNVKLILTNLSRSILHLRKSTRSIKLRERSIPQWTLILTRVARLYFTDMNTGKVQPLRWVV